MSTKTRDDYLPIKIVNPVATPAALSAIESDGQTVEEFLELHRWGGWGNLVAEEEEVYDRALMNGTSVESEFVTKNFDRIWVCTYSFPR